MRRLPPVVWIVLAALALHLTIALLFPLPSVFMKYNAAAEQILSGELPRERLLDFSPLYLQISLFAQRFLPAPTLFVEGLQILMIAAATGLLFLVLRRRVEVGLAALGALLLAADRHTLVYARILEPEALAVFLLCGFLFFVERTDRPRDAAFAGLFAALSLATRPTFLPAFLLIPVYFFFQGVRGRRLLLRTGLFLVPVALTMIWLTARAEQATGDPRTPLMSPGTVFFEGNNPVSYGTSAIYPPVTLILIGHDDKAPDSGHAHYRTVARADSGSELSIREVNEYWSSKAKRFLLDHPASALELWRTKLARVFHTYRWHDISTAWQYDASLRVPNVPFAIIGLLALIGCMIAARRWEHEMTAYLPVGVQLAVMLVFYVSARQRLAILPALLIFVVLALDAGRGLSRGRKIAAASLLLVLAVPLSAPNDLMRDESWRRLGRAEAGARLAQLRALSQEEPLAKNRELVVEAMASSPWWLEWMRPAYLPQDDGDLDERVADALARRLDDVPAYALGPALFDLAVAEIAVGRLDAAEERLLSLAESDTVVYRGGNGPSLPRFYLGRIEALRGRRDQALARLNEALIRRPGDPYVLAELVALGETEMEERLTRYFSDSDARRLISRARLVHGHENEALEDLFWLAESIPLLREAQIDLAVALGRVGRTEEAVEIYLQATDSRRGGRIEPLQRPADVADFFTTWATMHAGDAETALTAAEVLYRHGRIRRATAVLEAAEPNNAGESAAIERELSRLRSVLR